MAVLLPSPNGSTAARSSLARRFAGAAAALAGCAVLLIGAVSWWWVDRLQHRADDLLQQREAELRAAGVAETLQGMLQQLRGVARNPLLSTALTDSFGRDSYLQPYLGGLRSLHGVQVQMLVVDFQGHEVARNGDIDFTPAQRERLRQLLHEGATAALLDADDGEPTLLLAVDVRYPRTGTAEGAVWVKLPLARLLPGPGHELIAAIDPTREAADTEARLTAVTVPEALEPLALVLRSPRGEDVHLEDGVYLGGVFGIAAAVMLGLGWMGWGVGRCLTAELTALDRFATDAARREGATLRAPVQGPSEVAGLAVSINCMLDSLQARHEQLSAEARSHLHLLATCISNLNDVVLITEADHDPAHGHRIVFVNQAFERLTGYTAAEVMGRDPRLLQGPETDRAETRRIAEHLIRLEPVRAELVNYTRDGRRYWIELEIVPVRRADGRVTHLVAVERDVTARREAEQTQQHLEQQVREAQKMEAIGTLAAGIAHDFNNILGAVLGNVALARDELPRAHAVQQRLEQIDRSAARARSLVRQILSYSRHQEQQRSPQDLQALLDEAVALLRATVPASVALNCVTSGRPVPVLGEATELTQVLINLGTNAWQALQGRPGAVHFGLAVVPGPLPGPVAAPGKGTGGAVQAGTAPTQAQAHAHLWVQDNGCGMDAATVARVFEPFFTTKPVGTGTGLGLSVVQGIVRAHGGRIDIISQPGEGTTVHLRLPLLQDKAVSVAKPPPSVVAPPGQGERVLYVDDDAVMAMVVGALLQRWGYRVTTLDDAIGALQRLREDPDAFDLIVTDFNMPGITGLDLLRELRRMRPGLPVILTSGYLSDETRGLAQSAGASAVVCKENLPDELAGVISRTLRPVSV
jgi:PAS domain S-box-containing protein